MGYKTSELTDILLFSRQICINKIGRLKCVFIPVVQCRNVFLAFVSGGYAFYWVFRDKRNYICIRVSEAEGKRTRTHYGVLVLKYF